MVSPAQTSAMKAWMKGTYNCIVIGWLKGAAVSANVEYEVDPTDISNNLAPQTATTAVFSWIRLQLYHWNTNQMTTNEWYLIKCLAADAVQNLSDSDTQERLHEEKKILFKKLAVAPRIDYGGMPAKIKVELFNVTLNEGEELRLVCRPLTDASEHYYYGTLEYRAIGE